MNNTVAYLTTYRDDFRNPYSRYSTKNKPPKPPEWTRNNKDSQYRCDCGPHFILAKQRPIDFECGGENLSEGFYESNDKGQHLKTDFHNTKCSSGGEGIQSLNYSKGVMHCKPLKSDDGQCGHKQSVAASTEENIHKDPFPFRLFAVETAPNYRSPTDDICSGPSFSDRKNKFGISEYTDTISKTANKTMLAVQQYREPEPSSRRRWDNQFIQKC